MAVNSSQRQGASYTAIRFTSRLADAGIAPSTGSVGDSFDDALAENLWSTIKIELVYWPGTTFDTRAEADAALFRYIDGWYTPAVSSTVSADCPPTNTIKPTAHNTINSTPIASNRTPP